MKPMPMEEEEDDLSAISGVMSADLPEEEGEVEPEAASASPEKLVLELKRKIAELEASLSQL